MNDNEKKELYFKGVRDGVYIAFRELHSFSWKKYEENYMLKDVNEDLFNIIESCLPKKIEDFLIIEELKEENPNPCKCESCFLPATSNILGKAYTPDMCSKHWNMWFNYELEE